MGKKLVIVESPAKAKTINKYLGSDYVVRASLGHVRDLPRKKLGVDVDKNFKPTYEAISGRQKVLKELKGLAKEADAVYLAPDPDREGEAIAWHLAQALEKQVDPERLFRVTYNEITASAIKEAFSKPSRIDMNRVNAQQARRVLDRLVGYKVSPFLWRRVQGGSSAGRVQSVALRLVCEREDAIDNFVPEKYWLFGVKTRKQVEPLTPFEARLSRIDGKKAEITTQEQAEMLLKDLGDRGLKVGKITRKTVQKRARPPFITSSLQQSASSACGFTPDRTMRVAQKLYEGVGGSGGLITYMRTDSVNISEQAREAARAYIEQAYGADYIPEKPNFYKSKGTAQEAHEAIRPTDPTCTPHQLADTLDAEQLKLYTLIWQRFMASQMSPARLDQVQVEINADRVEGSEHSFRFRASSSEVAFPGYMKVSGIEKNKAKKGKDGKESDLVEQDSLPPLEEGERLERMEWLTEEKETKPPSRYSEASLVKALEENGVGRPSTYAQTISTIVKREYVDKQKRTLIPTVAGRKVNEFLVSHLGDLFAVGFTAEMETALDRIEEGAIEWTGMMKEFYDQFLIWLEGMKSPPADTAVVKGLLDLLADVQTWAAPMKRGKRTYSDEKFVTSISEQLEKGEKALTDRQLEALRKVAARYRDQLSAYDEKAEALGLSLEATGGAAEPPRDATQEKLRLLESITFAEPVKRGKRTYDDAAFSQSLREQVEGGRRLTPNQLRYLDRLVQKYSAQIPDYAEKAKTLGIGAEDADQPEDTISGPILELMSSITEWAPPTTRGKKTWSDQAFIESLASQFATRKNLSPRQQAVLKKTAARYASQIAGYEDKIEELGLLPPKKPKD